MSGHMFNMKLCTLLVFLFFLMIAPCLSLVPGFRSTVGELHQPAALSCEVRCSGPVKWIKIQKPSGDVVVARCDETSCSSEEGFNISHDQYLKGNLSLTITAADYSKRGWYTCWCEGKDVCDVSLRIKSVGFLQQVHPGDPLVLDFQVPEQLEVALNRRGHAGDGGGGGGARGAGGAQSSASVPVCSVEGRKLHCDDEYRKRTSLKCFLTLRAVQEDDTGVYSVLDTENDELISTHTVTLAGNDTDTNSTLPSEGKVESWDLRRIFEEEFRGLIVGGVMGLVGGVLLWFAVGWITMCCRRIMMKVRRCGTGDSTQQTDPEEDIELHKNANDQDDP
ncbi:hypothetical protein KOW79_018471 [Hemibagrus wyckioides]|uniref:Immunoglobulin domain-containing protein n=2 Tax=Hemibagrus wyckioides TaxID=337641 RepID=A0A9D3N8K2_9TELE|nr:hypothetical protein KOW79_018471 [Hemibagrus wyckioides]